MTEGQGTGTDTERFFTGLELVPPGLVPLPTWRPDLGPAQDAGQSHAYGGVGRKP